MSTRRKPSSVDARLHQVFDAPIDELYAMAVRSDASPALTRALELQSFLALAEEQVARVRDRVPPHPARPYGATPGHHRSPHGRRRPGTAACRGGPGPVTVKASDCPT